MKIKNVVKVMNFQALLRMDKSLKEADKYRNVGKEVTDILSRIMYNKNLILDKKILFPEATLPELNIYIANDYGFCGNFNSGISKCIRNDKDAYKIIIGKKIIYTDDKVLLKIDKEDFLKRFTEIENCIDKAVKSMNYSRINVYYNHYYSLTSFELLKIQLFPVEFKGEYYEGEDFVAETNLNNILGSLMTFYICYQLKMCESISYAAENVLRTQITSSALEKIEEKEEEQKHEEAKLKKEKSVLKSVENFKKIA
ncbi:MAG: F0F1 ATP synthase subunit gamma [Bacilli bacterium]|nr:F0F1 ATP synthase subunit gamma [Bacilli bacterium]